MTAKLAMKVDDARAGLEWNRMMIKLERQASSTIEAFLLENDDPRVLSARAAEWRESKTVVRRGCVDDAVCEGTMC